MEGWITWIKEKNLLDFGSKVWLEHEDLLGESSFHQGNLTFFKFFVLKSDFGPDELLGFEDQGFGIVQILVEEIQVLLWLAK